MSRSRARKLASRKTSFRDLKAVKKRKSRGISEEDFAVTVHDDLEDEIAEEREDIRKSLSEDALTTRITQDRIII